MDRSFPASCLQSADTQGTVATAACSSAILSHTHPPRSIHIDTAELDRRLLSIHKSNHSLPPPQLKRGRSGQPAARAAARGLDERPRAQRRPPACGAPASAAARSAQVLLRGFCEFTHAAAAAAVCVTLCRSYWISLAGAGQLPLWLLDARAKIKAAMSKAMYGEVSHTSPERPHAAARHSHTQIAVSALPLKGSPVCSKFFVRDMLGRGEVTLRHTTSAMRGWRAVFVAAKRLTRVAGGVTVCPVRHAVHVGSAMSGEHVQVPSPPTAPASCHAAAASTLMYCRRL